MLILLTGQPGNGKTLHALGLVESMRGEPTNRQPPEPPRATFYSGIAELTLPWVELDKPENWHECPAGSLVVIDECQRVFPPRKQGAAVPVHVQQFETHRHRGFDVVLITQHPQLLDIAVRKLVGRHIHVTRKFGRDTVTLSQWERCVDPHDRSVQSQALVTKAALVKERFGWYRSAEVHTVKKDFPKKKLAVLAACALGIPGLLWFAIESVTSKGDEAAEVAAADNSDAAFRPGASMRARGSGASGAWSLDTITARVEGIPASAPMYDGAIEIEDAPMISGCAVLQLGHLKNCECYDQQGNVIELEKRQCLLYYDRGSFDPRGKERYPTYEPYVPPLAPPSNDAGAGAGGGVAAPAPPSHRSASGAA